MRVWQPLPVLRNQSSTSRSMRMCSSALGLGSSVVTLSQSTTLPASSGSAAIWAATSAGVVAATRAQSVSVSRRRRSSASSSAVYLTIRSFFAIMDSPKGDDPLIGVPPHPYNCQEATGDLRGRDKPFLAVACRPGVDYRPPVEHYLGIPEVEAALGEHPQPLRLAPPEHDAMQAFCVHSARRRSRSRPARLAPGDLVKGRQLRPPARNRRHEDQRTCLEDPR